MPRVTDSSARTPAALRLPALAEPSRPPLVAVPGLGLSVEVPARTLRLLQRGALGQLRREHERTEHVAEFLDAELVLERLHAGTIHDDAERLEAR